MISLSQEQKALWIKENKRYFNVIFAISLIYALLHFSKLPLVIVGESSGFKFVLEIILRFLNFSLIPYAAINAIFFLKDYWLKPDSLSQQNILRYAGLVSGIIVGTTVFNWIANLFEAIFQLTPMGASIIIDGKVLSSYASSVTANLILGLIISVPVFIKQSKKQEQELKKKEQELTIEKLKQLKTQAELEALQAKINPHFLYNSLNSIAGLIFENPQKAEKMVISLSELFRYSTNSHSKNYVTVLDEVKMARTYFEIEKIRFDDALVYEEAIDENTNHFFIPRFLIQPLIENAIKHGASKVEFAKIKLQIMCLNQSLIIQIFDNGPNFPDNITQGYGLKSTFEKLRILFPNQFEVQCKNQPEKYIEIRINKLITSLNE